VIPPWDRKICPVGTIRKLIGYGKNSQNRDNQQPSPFKKKTNLRIVFFFQMDAVHRLNVGGQKEISA
jgi:hypothetical protein